MKMKRKEFLRKTAAAIIMVLGILFLSGCAVTDTIAKYRRTSDSEGLYTARDPYQTLIVVDGMGKHTHEFVVDTEGNITPFLTRDIKVVSANVKPFLFVDGISFAQTEDYFVVDTEIISDGTGGEILRPIETSYGIDIEVEPADAMYQRIRLSLINAPPSVKLEVKQEYDPVINEDGSVSVTAVNGRIESELRISDAGTFVLEAAAEDGKHCTGNIELTSILNNCIEITEEELCRLEDGSGIPEEIRRGLNTEENIPVITKNPTDETIRETESVLFIAYADNAGSCEWYITDGAGNEKRISEWKKAVPGLSVYGETGCSLGMDNVPLTMNGMKLKCRFTGCGGQTADSGYAILNVREYSREPAVTACDHNHAYSSSVLISSTCYRTGIRRFTCPCGAEYDEMIPKTGHVYSSGTCIYCGGTKPGETGTRQGSAESEVTSSDAAYGQTGTVQTVLPQIISVPEPEPDHEVHVHSWKETTTLKDPTCIASGRMIYTCSCGETKIETTGPLGHRYVSGSCTRCGEIDPDHIHTWDAGIVTEAPGCTGTGTRVYTCTICHSRKTETIPAAEHAYDSSGVCSVCGNRDNIFYGYGKYLNTQCMSDYDKMMAIVRFTRKNGYGGCTGYSGFAKYAADAAGLRMEYRTVGMIDCKGTGQPHSAESFTSEGYCKGCGLGDNHTWVRFYIGNDFYEFDIYGGDVSCIVGPNRSRH